ncbi:MGMT family protein [Runella aurantiaca]|uniref:Methylated-DNA--[protein]-cysteine S-methyltransferase n=1 Tax=Runella aurantiaca TaxID=2282308 RepID=A0A369I763_9BACT|nr:MGMT family protein [Runella aurantiaca]RDB05641.1 methylated-DNA--[protein]-cysteine S-methyltransferase [Runella aurantiaca]
MESKNFFDDVYDVVRQIPVGRVTSYGSIAKFLGSKLSARMVGWAMNACHGMPDVPAHRVVNRNGILSGKHFFGSPTAMQELLEREGIGVENDKIKNFKNVYWDPSAELL